MVSFEDAKRYIMNGLVKPEYKGKYEGKSPQQIESDLNSLEPSERSALNEQTLMEYDEEQRGVWMYTNFPTPLKRYRIDYERYDQSIEETYFWILNFLKIDSSFAEVDKITDVFAASEHSDFWGVSQQRMGLQQDRVSQFLAIIGKMIKEIFQLVRELRILDERLGYYSDSYSGSKSAHSAEVTLKGIYIDLVEGGSKNPASIYGMARELQFTILPDLFFDAPPMGPLKVDEYVDSIQFNEMVKRVLRRKLRAYIEWKQSTFKEIKTRRTFTVKYLKQHYDIIKMYMEWVKPYLKNIKRLRLRHDKVETADLISAFEGSMIEMEFLAKRKFGSVYGCVLAHFDCRTRPTMSFQQEGWQHKGPIHVGRIVLTLRLYMWTKEEVDSFLRLRRDENLELYGEVDETVKAAMNAMGDELKKYLREAGEKFFDDKPAEKQKQPSGFEPFTSVFKGFGELAGAIFPKKSSQGGGADTFKIEQDKEKAEEGVRKSMWYCYKNYRKANKMLAW